MRHSGVAACQRPRQASFSRRCVPAAPSSDFFVPLRASGSVKRLFGAAACQRPRQATFWRRCVPAASSSDFLASLRASGVVKRLFSVAFDPAGPSSDFLASLRASGSVMRHFRVAACQRLRPSDLPANEKQKSLKSCGRSSPRVIVGNDQLTIPPSASTFAASE